jgi:aminoglycoside phosphotransferase (APT) family kinase protein
MLFDLTVSDASFVDGRPPKDIKQTIEWIRERLGLDGTRPWTLISARTKLGRVLFEIEEESSLGTRRFIGKLGKTDRAEVLYQTLISLRKAGFQPPARMTVPKPIACVPERGVVIQEKVPGRQASDLLLASPGRANLAAADCARWLAALHQCSVPATVTPPDMHSPSRWIQDLAEILPDERKRLDQIAVAVANELAKPISGTVPTHGDFHPMNVLIAGTQRVIGIDMDKFASREPETDIGWFLMQAAAFGYFNSGTFATTEFCRRAFMQCYETEMGCAARPDRVGLYMALAFLKNIHFELALLKTGHGQYAQPWIEGAASAIFEGDIHLRTNS